MAKKLNLKVDSSDVRDFQGRVRFKFTRKFVQEGITGNGAVLSIGTENRFDTLMAEQLICRSRLPREILTGSGARRNRNMTMSSVLK